MPKKKKEVEVKEIEKVDEVKEVKKKAVKTSKIRMEQKPLSKEKLEALNIVKSNMFELQQMNRDALIQKIKELEKW